jgi:hypothetical protein
LNPSVLVGVTGNAPSGTVAVTGSPAFGDVCAPSMPTQSLAINNVGKCNLNIASAMVSCSDFTLVNNPFPATISHDSHVDQTVKWSPTSGGPKACNLVLTTDDPSNPTVTVPLTGDTPTPTISLPPAGLTFAPTVVQNSGNCHSTLGAPITNAGKCGLQVNSVALSGANATDYGLTGLSELPVTVGPGAQLGSGDLEAIFQPNIPLARTKTANVDVTYVSDPITNATSVVSIPMCGEATRRGLRVLVTSGGTPVPIVQRFRLWSVISKDEDEPLLLLQKTKNVTLQTVSGASPCPSFQYHIEYGTVANPIQLKPGNYRLDVKIKVGKKTKVKRIKVNLGTCDFDQMITVAF